MMTFTYKSRYGEYENCFFQVGHYANGNTGIEIWSNEQGPITKVTINPSITLPNDRIAIKDYSENEGMVDWLVSENLIEQVPVQLINSGWVTIPVHMLTPLGREVLSL